MLVTGWDHRVSGDRVMSPKPQLALVQPPSDLALAAEDYRKEFATVTKLLTKAAREASAASQTATGDCSAHALLAHQAA